MNLRDWLKREQMTDAAFAALVDCNQTTINRIRRGRTMPSLALIQRIAIATRHEVQATDLANAAIAAEAAA